MIQDYLQTQGLKLSVDDIKAALLTLQMVIRMGQASVEREILWRCGETFALNRYIEETPENELILKQIFMALDSAYSRQTVQSAAVYALMPSENQRTLVCLAQQGSEMENILSLDTHQEHLSLAVRSAQTGWLNLVPDVEHWLQLGEISGNHHTRCAGQLALPICRENGTVLGVVYVELAQKNALSDEMQIQWIALALSLLEPLSTWLNDKKKEENESINP